MAGRCLWRIGPVYGHSLVGLCLGFCLLLMSFGIGLVPYVLLWIFVPLDETVR